MNTSLEKYLNTIDRHLKPLPVSERVDIVKEIKSSILEMEQENLSSEEILRRLGDPKELAKAYLGDLLSNRKSKGRSAWAHFLTVCAFYSVVGFSGIVIIPTLGILAPAFLLSGIACPVIGLVKLLDSLLHLGLPFAGYIGISIPGIVEFAPSVEFLLTVIIGALFIAAGAACWKLLVAYCKKVSRTHQHLAV